MSDENGSVIVRSPPPRKGEVLFRSDKDWHANACIVHWSNSESARSNGRAACHLAEQVCESESEQDILVYPIVYLYRHHVELVLKNLIGLASDLLERDFKALGGHDLAELWNIARPLLNPVCELVGNPPFPPEDLDGIDSYICQIHEHDPDGQRFRYATAKLKSAVCRRRSSARGPSLSPELRVVNIRVFAVAMERLAAYLEGVESWFGHLHQQRPEMQDAYDP